LITLSSSLGICRRRSRGRGGGGSGFSFDMGYGQFRKTKMTDLNVVPRGQLYGFTFLTKGKVATAELFYKRGNYSSKINHDGAENTLTHTQTVYGGAINAHFSTRIGVKFGYFYYSYKQKLKVEQTGNSLTAVKDQYGFTESDNAFGILYGVNYNLFPSASSYNILLSGSKFQVSKDSYDFVVEMKLVMYFKSGTILSF
jgi:hypothetical protein